MNRQLKPWYLVKPLGVPTTRQKGFPPEHIATVFKLWDNF